MTLFSVALLVASVLLRECLCPLVGDCVRVCACVCVPRAKFTIGHVFAQEPTLFSGTLRGNLDPLQQSNDAAVWEALDKVRPHPCPYPCPCPCSCP